MVVGLLWVKGVVVKRVLARERRPAWGEGGWGRGEGRERVFLFSMVVVGLLLFVGMYWQFLVFRETVFGFLGKVGWWETCKSWLLFSRWWW